MAKRNPIMTAAESGLAGTYQREKAEWERRKAAFIEAAHTAMMRDPAMLPQYAYLKPSAPGQWGELTHVAQGAEAPDGFEPITAERIPSGTKDQIRRWFARYADRLPVYPMEVSANG